MIGSRERLRDCLLNDKAIREGLDAKLGQQSSLRSPDFVPLSDELDIADNLNRSSVDLCWYVQGLQHA